MTDRCGRRNACGARETLNAVGSDHWEEVAALNPWFLSDTSHGSRNSSHSAQKVRVTNGGESSALGWRWLREGVQEPMHSLLCNPLHYNGCPSVITVSALSDLTISELVELIRFVCNLQSVRFT